MSFAQQLARVSMLLLLLLLLLLRGSRAVAGAVAAPCEACSQPPLWTCGGILLFEVWGLGAGH